MFSTMVSAISLSKVLKGHSVSFESPVGEKPRYAALTKLLWTVSKAYACEVLVY